MLRVLVQIYFISVIKVLNDANLLTRLVLATESVLYTHLFLTSCV